MGAGRRTAGGRRATLAALAAALLFVAWCQGEPASRREHSDPAPVAQRPAPAPSPASPVPERPAKVEKPEERPARRLRPGARAAKPAAAPTPAAKAAATGVPGAPAAGALAKAEPALLPTPASPRGSSAAPATSTAPPATPPPARVVEAAPSHAPAAAPAPAPPARKAWLELFVNGVAHDPVLVVLDGDDVRVSPPDLERVGVEVPVGLLPGHTLSLRSLAPGLRFEVDEAAPALRLTVGAASLARRAVDLEATRRPAGLEERADAAAFLNYALQAQDDRRAAAFLEAGVAAGRWRATSGLARDLDERWSRGLTSAVRDDRERLAQLTAGDHVAESGALGGSLVLGGLSWRRELGLDPYRVHVPRARAEAVALTPSTLELYVDGTLVRRQQVGAGTLDLSNLPVVPGRGEVRAVLRDAFGREQEFSSTHYAAAGLLARGVSDYAYQAGLVRSALGAGAGEYARPVFLGRHRLGLTDSLTAGVRLDAGTDRASGGASATLGSRLGELEVAASASGAGGQAGAAGALSWTWRARRFGSTVLLRGHSDRYAHAGLDPADDRATREAVATVAVPVGPRASLFLDVGAHRWRDSGTAGRAAGSVSVSIGGGGSVHLGGGVTVADGTVSPLAQALLSWSLGDRTSVHAGGARQAGQTTGTASAQRALPRGEGYGYRVETSAGDRQGGLGEVAWNGSAVRVTGDVERRGGLQQARASVAGGLVAMKGGVYASRPLQESFALVDVPGVAGVRASLAGEEVGRTDERGRLLVPGLLPYHANRLAIRGADVPLDYDLGALERLVAPPRRGGAHVVFDVRRVRDVTGAVAVRSGSGSVPPSFGELRVAGADPSPLTEEGRFYLSNLPEGRHAAEVEYGGGTCRFTLDVPPADRPITDLGLLVCGEPALATPARPSSPSARRAGRDEDAEG